MQNSRELQQLLEVCQREGCLLCRLAHFQQACELKLPGSSEATGEWLAQLRRAQLAQLGELIRKHDYRFRDEAHGDEMISWRWAASIVAGEDERVNI